MMRWVAGVAASYEAFEQFCLQTTQQWLPHRTCSRVAEWEAALGLPDPCIGYVDDPVLARTIMLSRIRGLYIPYTDSSPSAVGSLEKICLEAGYAVNVSYSASFRVGRNRVGERLGQNGIINIHYPQVCKAFRVGDNHTGQRLVVCPVNSTGLECLLQRIVPARYQLYIYL
jgi:uncharacterized protein YmfQ (DUF2313 family)